MMKFDILTVANDNRCSHKVLDRILLQTGESQTNLVVDFNAKIMDDTRMVLGILLLTATVN